MRLAKQNSFIGFRADFGTKAAVDATKDKDAKRLLLKAMDGMAFLLDPPRGQLEEIKK